MLTPNFLNVPTSTLERITLEYSHGDDSRLIRKTTEAFDDNGNVINTQVENYE